MTYKEQCRNKEWKFPIVIQDDNSVSNLIHIHPLKQKIVHNIIHDLQNKNLLQYINRLIVFGSSITMACRPSSDLDIAVDIQPLPIETVNKIYDSIGENTDWNCDVLWIHRLKTSDRIYSEIMKGQVIYTGQLDS